jgi:hypothetical protein
MQRVLGRKFAQAPAARILEPLRVLGGGGDRQDDEDSHERDAQCGCGVHTDTSGYH